MPHETPLIATISIGLGLAFLLGLIAQRIRLPPIVGYLAAGIIVGPFTPGYVADQKLAVELAEIGVILLMFGVGLHFSLKDLLSVRAIAIPGAIGQIVVATAMGTGLALLMGWSVGAGVVFGLALSVASTVVLLRALQERRQVETEKGKDRRRLADRGRPDHGGDAGLAAAAGSPAGSYSSTVERHPGTSGVVAKPLVRPRHDRLEDIALRSLDAGTWPQGNPLGSSLRRAHRLTGTLPVGRARHRSRRGFRIRQALRRFLRAGRILCRHGVGRISIEHASRQGNPASA